MKNIFNIIALLGITLALSAQTKVSIEKDDTGNPSVLLEFNDRREAAKTAGSSTVNVNGVNKSLILPVVEDINENSVPGTIWLDANDDIIKYKKSASETVNMTLPSDTDVVAPTGSESTTEKGVIIGAESSTAKGVLVLESTTQAMVLPHVDSVADVINPEPGSMVYAKDEKGIALFNGERWTFWVK